MELNDSLDIGAGIRGYLYRIVGGTPHSWIPGGSDGDEGEGNEMKKLALLLLVLLLVLMSTGCSKKNPASPSPATFVLEVDNRTILDFDIYVDGEYAGVSEANTVKEMGSFNSGSNTHIEVMFNDVTVMEFYENTTGAAKFTLVIATG